MNRITQLLGVSALALALAACNSGSSFLSTGVPAPEPEPEPEPEPPVLTTQFRVHHASADAPAVNITVNGENFLENVDYQQSSGVASVDEGTYTVGVDAILATGDVATVIGPVDLDLDGDMRYEIFAVGRVDDESLEPLIVANEVSDVTAGDARIQVVHGVPGAPDVDVYLTEFDVALEEATPAATLAYQEFTPQVSVAAGDYQVRVTVAGDTEALLFDSGEIALPDGADLVIAATLNIGSNSGDRPIVLLLADGEASSILYSVDTGADIRVVHAVADAPNVDVWVDDAVAIADLPFLGFTPYVNLPADEYRIRVTPAGAEEPVVIDVPALALDNGLQASVLAVGSLTDGTINPAVLAFSNRRVSTEAIVRIVHASPSAGEVDIYVTATADIEDAEPAFAGVDFDAEELQTTGNVSLPPGEYYVSVTLAGTKDIAIGPVFLELVGGGLYTAVAVDADGGGLLPQLILLDDLAADDD
ncbi:MAG: DUF4397 domain-containing protein [Idiomarina sp.]|nr:DUF4397 domain-containing protein [Idiomarina sp.]